MVEAESLFDEAAFALERRTLEPDPERVAQDLDGVGVPDEGHRFFRAYTVSGRTRFRGVHGFRAYTVTERGGLQQKGSRDSTTACVVVDNEVFGPFGGDAAR